MEQGLVKKDDLTAIANAIRGKNGTANTYTPAEMAKAINGIKVSTPTVIVSVKNSYLYGMDFFYVGSWGPGWSAPADNDYVREVSKGTVFRITEPCPIQKVRFTQNGEAVFKMYLDSYDSNGKPQQYLAGFVAYDNLTVEFSK